VDNDDEMIGRILSRREVLKIVGAASMTVLVGCGTSATTTTDPTTATTVLNEEAQTAAAIGENPSAVASQEAEVATAEAANTEIAAADGTAVPNCVVRPEVTEGPYYVDVNLVRSDVREDRTGAPFQLTFNVSQVTDGSCTAYEGVTVEIWHCDGTGAYSGVSDPGFDTSGQTWLRGAQVTDANGVATFTTIYPGWYGGRAVHIHFKVAPSESQVFTSQLFFPDELSQQVFTQEPYTVKSSTPDTLNSTDNIYQDLLLMEVRESGDGYAATFPIGIDLSTIGSGESGGGLGGPGGPPPGGPPPSTTTTPTS
jgi:protocatechuate 3,4-dioxygenase beta subunit